MYPTTRWRQLTAWCDHQWSQLRELLSGLQACLGPPPRGEVAHARLKLSHAHLSGWPPVPAGRPPHLAAGGSHLAGAPAGSTCWGRGPTRQALHLPPPGSQPPKHLHVHNRLEGRTACLPGISHGSEVPDSNTASPAPGCKSTLAQVTPGAASAHTKGPPPVTPAKPGPCACADIFGWLNAAWPGATMTFGAGLFTAALGAAPMHSTHRSAPRAGSAAQATWAPARPPAATIVPADAACPQCPAHFTVACSTSSGLRLPPGNGDVTCSELAAFMHSTHRSARRASGAVGARRGPAAPAAATGGPAAAAWQRHPPLWHAPAGCADQWPPPQLPAGLRGRGQAPAVGERARPVSARAGAPHAPGPQLAPPPCPVGKAGAACFVLCM